MAAFIAIDLFVAMYWFFGKDINHLQDPYGYEALEMLLADMLFGLWFAVPGGLLGLAFAAGRNVPKVEEVLKEIDAATRVAYSTTDRQRNIESENIERWLRNPAFATMRAHSGKTSL